MQFRMKTHQLNQDQIENLLNTVQTGTLATIRPDGTPYVTPIHFVFFDNQLYFHGLPLGQKIENIKNNSAVSFSAYIMEKLLLDPAENPCDTNTQYQSVLIQGNASLITDLEVKRLVLRKIIQKYTPHLADKPLPEGMVKGTAVLQVSCREITGKYYK
ncbi:Pyridoxamine 5'-phosphate oxidase [anaerobic digester metagenome]